MRKSITALLFFIASTTASSADLVHGFRNPSFNGQGYSGHVLAIEQLGFNRKQEIQDAAASEAARIERELENSTLNRFLRNIESRIYATISKQMVDNMFASCEDSTGATCPSTGTAEIEGNTIIWERDVTTGAITLTVDTPDGNTVITIPGAGEFSF